MTLKRIEPDFGDQTLEEIRTNRDQILTMLEQVMPADVDGFAVVIQTTTNQVITARSNMTPKQLYSSVGAVIDQLNDDTAVSLD